jgi:glucose/arabinose dehydrogenase
MKCPRFLRCLVAAALLALPAPLLAAIQVVPVVSSGLAGPLFAGNAGDGTNRLFIVEKGGVIRVLQPGASAPTAFLDIHAKVDTGGERGLLGLAFHPQYASNGRFFVDYTRAADGAIVIAEYGVSGNPNVAATTETVLLAIPHPTYSNHNGGMIAFGSDGYLYVGVGDGGAGNDPANNAQNVNVLLGKILRIDVDHPDIPGGTPYSSPADNPYVGTAGRDEIYSIGWRNPWRFSFDRTTHQQWVADVGQDAREEVDTPIVKGGNYGWRVYEGSACTGLDASSCVPANYVFPLFEYLHTGGRCAITGGYVYSGTQGTVAPGTYVYGDSCTGEIFGWNGTTQTVLLGTGQSIVSFGEDEQGELYAVNYGGSVGKIVRSDCTYAVAPPDLSNLAAAGGPAVITVTTTGGCPVTATSYQPWVAVTGPTPNASGATVQLQIGASAGAARATSIVVAGRLYLVTQLGQ